MRLIVAEAPRALRRQAVVLLSSERLTGRLARFGCSTGALERSVLEAWQREIAHLGEGGAELTAAVLGQPSRPDRPWEDELPAARWLKTRSQAYPLDLALVGIGADGALGPLSPGDRFFERPETHAGAAKAAFLTAEHVIAIVSGARHAEALAAAVEGDITEDCPASALQLVPQATVLADRAAARALIGKRLHRDSREIEVFDPSLERDRSWVVLSPHPDDTSVSCGGLIDQIADRSRVVSFLMCSGHHAEIPGSRDAAERRRIRLEEAEAEGRLLRAGVVSLDLEFYDHRYQYLGEDAARLTEALVTHEADVVVLPSSCDRHPAHRISRVLGLEAVRRYVRDHRPRGGVELWGFEGPWGIFDRLGFNLVVPVPLPSHRKKIAALRKHRSQIERLPYDQAATHFSHYRALLVPELRLSAYGSRSQTLGPHVELFQREWLRFG